MAAPACFGGARQLLGEVQRMDAAATRIEQAAGITVGPDACLDLGGVEVLHRNPRLAHGGSRLADRLQRLVIVSEPEQAVAFEAAAQLLAGDEVGEEIGGLLAEPVEPPPALAEAGGRAPPRPASGRD